MRHFRRFTLLMGFALITSIVILHGCAEINHLREAQVTFNETARLDNEYRAPNKSTAGDALTQQTIRTGYAAVILSLESLSADQIDKLKHNRLIGTAYVLQAISYQRLGETEKARDVINKASNLSNEEIDPRDRGIIAAWDGFTSNAQAYQAISFAWQRELDHEKLGQDELNAIYSKVNKLLELAIENYKNVRTMTPEGHGLRVYLDEAGLAALSNHMWALDVLDQGMGVFDDEIKPKISEIYATLLKDMCDSGDYTAGQIEDKFDYWNFVTEVKPPGNTSCP